MNGGLAIYGGPPVRTTPLTGGHKWGQEELEELRRCIESGRYFRFSGPTNKVVELEQAFAQLYSVKHAIASTSGTAAIHVAIGMLDLQPGDEIITAPITDGGSIVPILYQGALPVFPDSDPDTFLVTPGQIARCITSRTRAIMVVHLFGNAVDMDGVMEIARAHRLPVIEDCSQAHMARYKGRLCGTIGDIGAFSLQAGKHMTTGDGGMTITNDDAFARRGEAFMDKGWARKPDWGARTYLFLAPNYRMSVLCGAVGLAQTRKVTAVAARRHEHGARLRDLTADVPWIRPQETTPGAHHTYWLYAFVVEPGAPFTAPEMAKALVAEGIPANAQYIGLPIPLCMEAVCNRVTFGTSSWPFTHPGARAMHYEREDWPVTVDILDRMITLPISEFFTEADIGDVAAALRKVALGCKSSGGS